MATAYMSRTLEAATSRKICTFSAWIKRGKLGGNYVLFGGGDSIARYAFIDFNVADRFFYLSATSDATDNAMVSNRRFRDTAGWYHIVYAMDTTQAAEADRAKLYVNGVFDTDPSNEQTGTTIAQDYELQWTYTGDTQLVGKYPIASDYWSGIMSHVYYVDGTALTPSTFGEVDATSGIWKIKTAPTGFSYGNQGFCILKDSNTGTDSSGNGNNFTTTNTITTTVDSPSNNYATLNPLDNYYQAVTFSNGNTTIAKPASPDNTAPSTSTLGVSSGKWYWETKCAVGATASWLIGIMSTQVRAAGNYELGKYANDYAYSAVDGDIRTDSAETSYGNTYAAGDIIGVALDLTNNKLYFSKNGTWQDSGDPTSGATGTGAISITTPASTSLANYFPAHSFWSGTGTATTNYNFGNGYFGTTAITSAGANAGSGLFEYDVPSGYLALNTKNIATDG